MLKMVDGTGIIGVDMICPLGISTPQPPNYDRVEMEGTGMLVLPNSLDAPLERLELGGKTEQVQTSGKNLLDVDAIIDRKGINGSGEVINKTGSCVTDFIFLKPETYTFSLDNKSKDTQIAIYLYNDDKSFNKYLLSNLNETSKIIVDKNMYMIVMFNKEKSIVLNKHVMLEIGSNKTDYEPYTGGKPSPSPEYPQEIKNSGKWNGETQKYEVDAKITGKNLFDKSLLEGGKIVEFNGKEYYKYNDNAKNYIYKGKFKNGQQYAFTLRILRPASKESNETTMEIVHTDGTRKWTRFKHGELKTLVSDPGKTIDHFRGGYNYGIDCYLDLSVTRLSVGGQDAGYAPYKEQTITITSDRPITKWDKLVEQDGQIGWLYGSYVGRLPKTGYNVAYKADGQTFYFRQVLKSPDVASKEQYFNLFKCGDKNTSKVMDVALITIDRNILEIALDDISIDSTVRFEEYIHRLPDMEVVYQTQEYEFVPLPQSEQDVIRALLTYYPTTVITVDGGEVDPDIKVTYRKEI